MKSFLVLLSRAFETFFRKLSVFVENLEMPHIVRGVRVSCYLRPLSNIAYEN